MNKKVTVLYDRKMNLFTDICRLVKLRLDITAGGHEFRYNLMKEEMKQWLKEHPEYPLLLYVDFLFKGRAEQDLKEFARNLFTLLYMDYTDLNFEKEEEK